MNRLVKYLSIVVKWRKFLFWNTFVVTAIAVGVSFVLPKRYLAVARILPPSEVDPLGMSSVLGGGLGGGRFGRLRISGMMGSASASDLLVGILASRSVMGNVVVRCSIIQHYRVRRNSMESAIKVLRRLTRLVVEDDGIVTIKVEAKNPRLAALIANTYIEELDDFLRRSNVSQGRNMRIFLERRLGEVAAVLAEAQESLRVFQQVHRLATVDEETKAAIEVYARLRSQLLAKQAELAAAEYVSGADNPLVSRIRGDVEAFASRLSKLEWGESDSGFGVGFGVSFEKLPSVGAEYARRFRDVRIQEETYAMLYQQYEYARVMEARDTPALTVLDYAIPPERKSYPRRLLIAAAAFLFSLIVGLSTALIADYVQGTRDSRPDEYQAWQALLEQVRGGLGRRSSG